MTLLSRIPVMLLSFLAVVFLTRLLGSEGNGVYTFAMASLNLFITVMGFQLEGALPVFLSKNKENTAAVFSATGILALISLLAFSISLIIIVFLIPGGYRWVLPSGQPTAFFFVFLIIAFLLRRTSVLMQASLRGLFMFKGFNGLMILNQLIPAVVYGIILIMTIFWQSVIPLHTCFIMILCTETILVLAGIGILWKSNTIRFNNDYKTFLKPVYTYSFNNMLSAIGQFMNKRLDVWFVQFYKGTIVLGQYGLATQITNFVSEAMTPLNQVMIPYIAESAPDQHCEIVERSARLNMTIALIASFLVITTSWIFIPVLFGNSFLMAVPATQILAIGIIFISQRLVFAGYFRAINLQQYTVRAAWSGVIITVILDFLLIPSYGIIGASWATIVAYGISTCYLVIIARRKLGFQLANILVLRRSDVDWLLSTKPKNDKGVDIDGG